MPLNNIKLRNKTFRSIRNVPFSTAIMDCVHMVILMTGDVPTRVPLEYQQLL